MSAANSATYIGRVRHVLGARVVAELDEEMAGTSPLYQGRLHRVGQLGSIVRVPQGNTDLLGTVTMVGIAELAGTASSIPNAPSPVGDRWLQFQLLGELDPVGNFKRGVSSYPSLDDQVHFATDEVLSRIYPVSSNERVHIGTISGSGGQPFTLDVARLVMRHSAILGSTGAGKSSTVATLIQSVVQQGFSGANIVVIDPHGEYAAVAAKDSLTLGLGEEGPAALTVPYWALGLEDLVRVFAPGMEAATRNRFAEEVVDDRLRFLKDAKWDQPRAEEVTVDTPVPFDLRRVWYEMDYDNRAIFPGGKHRRPEPAAVVDEGDAASLKPATFEPYGPGGAAPFQGHLHGHYGTTPGRLRSRLLDARFAFLARAHPNPADGDPLPGYLASWLGGGKPVSVLDFSGIPSDVSDVAIGLVLELLLSVAMNGEPGSGLGRARPVLIVLEEAHRFVGGEAPSAQLARMAVDRIAREGRKYGVGLMLVSQRPSELSATALAQCGTLIAMRLTNASDQGTVRAALPDALEGLAELLPSLRTGEALISGEAAPLPSRVMIRKPNPEPTATDPSVESWRTTTDNDLVASIARWRGIEKPAPTNGH